MMDMKATKVYAMVMYDGTVIRDVINPTMRSLHDANLVITCSRSLNLQMPVGPVFNVYKNRFPGRCGDVTQSAAEVLITQHVTKSRVTSNSPAIDKIIATEFDNILQKHPKVEEFLTSLRLEQ